MTATTEIETGKRVQPVAHDTLAPDTYERILALVAIILMSCVVVAVFRGQAQWHLVPTVIWLHLATITVALCLTPIMLLRHRGDGPHRKLGWFWVSAMFLTAVDSLFIRTGNPYNFSIIQILSVFVIVQVPRLAIKARRHQIDSHRRAVRGMVTGALLIAGFFTFPFDRLLGHWLFG